MKKIFLWLMIVTVAVSMVALFSLVGCDETTATETTAAGTTAAGTTAAGTSAEANGYKVGDKLLVGLSIRGLDNPYYIELVEGVEKFIEYAPGSEMVVMEHHGDNQKEINDVTAFAARGETAILYIDAQSQAVLPPVAEACEEAGIYWTSAYTLGVGVYPWTYEYFVSHQALDDVTGGYEIAKEMFTQFNGEDATILCMAGELSNLASIKRIEGMEKALEEFPNVTLLDTQPGDWMSQTAMDIAQTWLIKYPDVDGIWVANDAMAVGVVETLKAKGLNGKIKVVAIDCIPAGLEAVMSGDMSATFYPYPKLMGGYGVAMAYAALTGKIDPDALTKEQSCYLTPGELVTTANAATFKADVIDKAPVIDFNNPMVWGESVGPLIIDEATGQ